MRHIVILTHPNDDFAQRGYALAGVADQWRQNGFQVTVLRGPEKHVDADLAILHVDLTVVPDEYIAFMRNYPLAINPLIRDISKRTIRSKDVVAQGDGYEGPVIIKTNLNCGGASEGALARNTSFLKKCIRAVHRRLHWSLRSEINMWDYPVLDSPAEVPLAAWHNPHLVVEKFLPERRDGHYCLRSWIFLGDAELTAIMYANQPIVKSPVAVRIENGVEIPDEMRRIRKSLGFEFGKFDFGIVDGRCVLYDANRTPVMLPKPENVPEFKRLAIGVESFFRGQYRAAG